MDRGVRMCFKGPQYIEYIRMSSGMQIAILRAAPAHHDTVASNTLSSDMLQHSTSSMRLGLDEMVMTELVPTNFEPDPVSDSIEAHGTTHPLLCRRDCRKRTPPPWPPSGSPVPKSNRVSGRAGA